MDLKQVVEAILANPLAQLTDQDLEEVHNACLQEQSKRCKAAIERGDYPPVTAGEIRSFCAGDRINTIIAYRNRTKLSLSMARDILVDICTY
jgi:hypothetical protein